MRTWIIKRFLISEASCNLPLPLGDVYEVGKSPYEVWRDRQGVPVVTGNYVEDDLKLSMNRWKEWGDGVKGCILTLGQQQAVDKDEIEIDP